MLATLARWHRTYAWHAWQMGDGVWVLQHRVTRRLLVIS